MQLEDEFYSELTTENIDILEEGKSKAILNSLIGGMGFVLIWILFYLLNFRHGFNFVFFLILNLILSIILIPLFISGIRNIRKVNREIKVGKKITFIGKIEDYLEIYTTNKKGDAPDKITFYFIFSEKKLKVNREQFYSFLTGDLVKVSYSPALKEIFEIEKVVEKSSA